MPAVSDCRTPNEAGMMLSKHLWNLGLNVGRVVNTSPRRWLRSVSRHPARIAIAPSLFRTLPPRLHRSRRHFPSRLKPRRVRDLPQASRGPVPTHRSAAYSTTFFGAPFLSLGLWPSFLSA